jgi:hypothetical protein
MEMWLSRSLSHELFFFTMEIWLSRSLSHELFLFSRWNSGYQGAFHTNFKFSRWNFGYQGAFLMNFFFFHDGILAIKEPFSRTFSFFTMEFWLSRSLSHELFLFSRWNSGYHEAFLTKLFFFHDGILAIMKPFSRTFSFFTMEFWLSRSISHELFLFHDGILAITKPFSRTFSFFTMKFWKYAIWGKTLFIYITKSIYIRSASFKTLPLDLEPPLQGKEYGPSYSNTTRKSKANLFSRNHL